MEEFEKKFGINQNDLARNSLDIKSLKKRPKLENTIIFSSRIVSMPTTHGVDVYPVSAAGVPFTASYIAAKGDPIANLQEDLAAEQKARATYEKLIDLCRDNPDVLDPLKFLRQREIVHFQRFGETLRGIQDKLAERKFYMNNMN